MNISHTLDCLLLIMYYFDHGGLTHSPTHSELAKKTGLLTVFDSDFDLKRATAGACLSLPISQIQRNNNIETILATKVVLTNK